MYLRYLTLLFVPSEPIDVVLNLTCPELKDTWNTGTSVVWDVPKVAFVVDKYKDYIDVADLNECCSVTCDSKSGKSYGSELHKAVTCNTGYCSECVEKAKTSVELVPDTCTMSFRVTEVYCEKKPPLIEDGYFRCSTGPYIAGSTCDYTCRDGYTLEGSGRATCSNDGTDWSSVGTCKPKQCKKSKDGHFTYPDGTGVHSLRWRKCTQDGYTPSPPGFSQCTPNQQWIPAHVKCEDTKPPQFNNCPDERIIKAASGENVTMVEWPVITVSDNSNETIEPKSNVATPGVGSFPLGSTLVKFTAEDKSKNRAMSCVFIVVVENVICPNPWFDVKYLTAHCGKGMSIGKSCELTCELSLERIGEQFIMCTLIANTTEGYWAWKNGTDVEKYKPSCRVHNCTELPAPNNGAMVCDTWSKGAVCQMQCQEGYDIPDSATFTPQYICGMDKGVWIPDTVSNCSYREYGENVRMPEYYYFTGPCEEAQQEIKENFLKVISNKDLCTTKVHCTVENVKVKCCDEVDDYDLLNRRKRGSRYGRRRRPNRRNRKPPSYIMFDVVILNVVVGNQNFAANMKSSSLTLKAIARRIAKTAFRAGGRLIRATRARVRDAVPICRSGHKIGYFNKDSCVPCPAGSYHNSTRDECMACGYGQYQSQEGQTSCTGCPEGKTTITLANVDVSSCKEMCGPGTYSTNGVVPCFKCPLRSYQHQRNRNECIQCPVGTTTEDDGANSTSHCVAFDFLLQGPITVPLEGMKPSRICDFTFALWIKLVDADYGGIKFQVYSPTVGTAIDISVSSDIRVILRERDELHVENVMENKWVHVAVAWSHPKLTVYVGGAAIAEEVFEEAQDCPSSTPSVMEITIRGHAYMYLRDLNFLPSAKSDVVGNMSTSCSSYNADSLFSLERKDMEALDKVLEVVPSTCMKPDVCLNQPCGDNVCIPTGSNFTCVCRGGYSGDKCDVPPDLCKDNICSNNATCLVTSYGYRCECQPGYRGDLCKGKIADGGWGEWMDWGACSVSCGNGTRARHRYCDNPFPDTDGKPCDGNSIETTFCQKQMCPECALKDLVLGKGIIKTCHKNDGSIICSVECERGLVFPEEPFVYTCKKGTWMPTKRTVSCTEPVTPLTVGINYTVVFGDSIDSHQVISPSLNRVGRNFSCTQSRTCSIAVGTSMCNDHVRICGKYDGVYYGSLLVQMAIQQNTIDVFKLQKNKQVMAYLSPLFATWNVFTYFSDEATTVDHRELEMSITNETLMVYPYDQPSMAFEVPGQFGAIMKTWKLLDDTNWEVRDKSYTDFQITLANQSQPQQPKLLSAIQTMTCPRGAVQGGVFCIKCPPGKSYDSDNCKRCRHGFYQDVPGMSSCVACPGFQTTELLGSPGIAQCKDTDVEGINLVVGMRDSQIGILHLRGMKFESVSLNISDGFVDHLAYNPRDEFIYFTTQEPTTIGRVTMGGLDEEALFRFPQDTIITGFDIDVATGLLFYTSFDGVLAALHVSSGAEYILLSNLTKPRGLVLDQKLGMYWVESDTINYLHYSSKMAKTVFVDTNAVWNPILHKHGNKITWNTYTRLREAYINGSNVQTIASNFTSRFGYTDEFYFYLDKNAVLMRVNRDQSARAAVFSLPESAIRMRVVNTTNDPSFANVCSGSVSDCDHGCFPANATTRICFCALDFTLQSNNRTCRRDFSGQLETKARSWEKPLASDYSVPPSMTLRLRVKACHSARVALAETGKRLYLFELDRRRGNETEMSIRKLWAGSPPVVLVHKTVSRLDCDDFRFFWITWSDRILRIGRGKTLYTRQILVAKDSRPFIVNFAMFGSGFNATAVWQF
ncbi:uncharacterized protein LOC124149848 isoform X2 [Haliotis rufescens]|uniref:uncharacterized protein LOC124149848 isoform X2 n=1 Tax=Haliotis rufescens TaxID=6454 RepID=UPI00201F8206|nr:uncharacterized protein LOC124149848 isoform X2 [Haliotis rufescens]